MKLIILVSAALLLAPMAMAEDSVAEQRRLDQIQKMSAVWMKMRREADDFAQKKKWSDAEQRLQQILAEREKLKLDLVGEQSALASIYVKAGQKDKAEALYKAIIAQREKQYGDDDFTLVYPLNDYATFLRSIGRTKDATTATQRAAAIEADSRKPPTKRMNAITKDASLSPAQKAEKLTALGNEFFDRDNALKARFAFDQAIALNPKLSSAYAGRARAYMQLEELQKAMADLNKAVALDSKNAAALADRARLFQNFNKPKLALRDFTAAISARPSDTDTIGWRAKQYDSLGQTDKAIADYTTVLKLSPEARWALIQRSLLYKKQKNYKLALADLDRVLKLTPENLDARELRAGVEKEMKK